MKTVKLQEIRALGETTYLVTFVGPDGPPREFEFVVNENTGVPGVQWTAEFERMLGMRLSLARPVVAALLSVHSCRGVGLEIV